MPEPQEAVVGRSVQGTQRRTFRAAGGCGWKVSPADTASHFSGVRPVGWDDDVKRDSGCSCWLKATHWTVYRSTTSAFVAIDK